MAANNAQNVSINRSEDVKNIAIICPTCKKKKMVAIPTSVVKKNEGLTSVSFRSGQVCDHVFQAFIDKNFFIRGYQKIDLEVEADSSLGNPAHLIKSDVEAELVAFINADHEVMGALVARSKNNFSVAVLPDSLNKKLVRSISIAFAGLSRRVSKNLFDSAFKNLTLDMSSNMLFITSVGEFVLSVVTKENPNVAMMELEIEALRDKILPLLKQLERVNG